MNPSPLNSQQWLDFLNGRLSEAEIEQVAELLQQNPLLANEFQGLIEQSRGADAFVTAVRVALRGGTHSDDPSLRSALVRLHQLVSDELKSSASAANPGAKLPIADERDTDRGAGPTVDSQSPPVIQTDPRLLGQQTDESLASISLPLARPADDSGEVFPRAFGRYRLEKKLGEGGMGAVYLAVDTALDRRVALKVPILSQKKERELVLKRFQREAKAVAALDHPNICAIYDVADLNGQPYMAMAYVNGRPLSDLVKAKGFIPIPAALRLVGKLAQTLEHAHQRGVIHRDLKPANILINDRKEPIVMDFGLARRDGMGDPELTKSGQIMGTPAYMSPEQAGMRSEIGPCSDIYSLGVILYELLTKQRPFTGDLIEMLTKIALDVPEPPSKLRSSVDPQVDALVLKALEKKPANRYATMAEFAQAIGAVLKTMPDPIAKIADPVAPQPAAEIAPAAAAASQPTPTPKAARQTSPTQRMPAISPVVALGGLAACVLLATIFAVTLRTKDGEIVVQSLRPGAVITVDGERIHVVKEGEDTYTIRQAPGEMKVAVALGGYEIFSDDVTLKTRGQETIRVLWRPLTKADPPTPPAVIEVPAGGSVTVVEAEPKPTATWQPTAEQQAFFDQVAKLGASEKIAAVVGKLQELNPGYDGKFTSKPDKGEPTEFKFSTLEVSEIWPVRALTTLTKLTLGASYADRGKLRDISPLAGMKLTSLSLAETRVNNLSSLAGMPLTSLTLNCCAVRDLTPLAGMPLTNLQLGTTSISDITPLAGMPLKTLGINYTYVVDLSPLRGMKITSIDCEAGHMTDLTPLEGMPLEWINFTGSKVADLSPLTKSPLKTISCGGSKVTDLSFMIGSSLTNLNCEQTAVSDLKPLAGSKLTTLNIRDTLVTDLSPLAGLPLHNLNCSQTDVSDGTPLKGLPLSTLNCENTLLADLSPLAELKLKELTVPARRFLESDETVLRSLKLSKLGSKGSRSPDEYFAELARSRKAADELTENIEHLSPKEQATAVEKSLEKINDNKSIVLEPTFVSDQVVAVKLTMPAIVSDISSLRALTSLRRLTLVGASKWLDLSPLNSLPLEELTCPPEAVVRCKPALASIRSLKTINGAPVETALK